ncbi:helix-turn-helix domain-containing protein [Taibaiella chishuiensis]|uniref:AraC family transcriptional regulator n=1 Tax=Taibaiella chishuiensis TaxID=1434707 RepID=A0A2P8D8T8_9BACT|nr:AraC family transcriptional regulator [Taibaiella chishuiensis]PSK93591.1 AraC family transcriptional regulator [Taibaiella chishuiensis]
MNIVKTYPAYLRQYVQFFYTIRANGYLDFPVNHTQQVQRRLPDGTLDLVFNLGGHVELSRDGYHFQPMPLIALTGLYPDRSFLKYEGAVYLVGAVLQPGAAHLFVNDVLEQFKASTIDGADVFGPSIYTLPEKLIAVPAEKDRHEMLERFLLPHLKENKEPDNFERVLYAVHQVHGRKGDVDVSLLARTCLMSERNFRRKFTEFVGIGPKKYAGIVRVKEFCKVYERSRTSYVDILCALGYTDQAHFSKDFRKITGTNPTVYFNQLTPVDSGLIHLI